MDLIIGVGNCLGNGLLSQSALKESALLLGAPTAALGKVQWLFPGIEFTCDTVVTSLSYTTPMPSGKMKHPIFQIWRNNNVSGGLTYELIERVNSSPMPHGGEVDNVYTYSDLRWPVQAKDVLGVYQPEITMSGTRWSYQDGFGPVSYFKKASILSFAVEDTLGRRYMTPLVFIEVAG